MNWSIGRAQGKLLRMISTVFLLRPEVPGDVPGVFGVNATAFPTDAEARLVDQLRASGRLSISLVAVVDERVVGHVALSPVTIAGTVIGLGLAPVAVLPEWQLQGIGGALIRRGLDECRTQGVGCVVVLGEPTYYQRFGFVPASRWSLLDEYGGGEAFQTIELVPDTIPGHGGLVTYAPEFAMFGE